MRKQNLSFSTFLIHNLFTTMKSKTFEQHLQESCGGGYSFTDILNNLESTELLECIIDFAETQKEDTVSFGKLQLLEFIQRLQKDFE